MVRKGPVAGAVAGSFAWAILRLRFLIVPAWIAAAVAATVYLPGVAPAGSGGVGDLVPSNAAAVQAEISSTKLFGFPIIARTAIVQRDPRGLSTQAQARVLCRSLVIDRQRGLLRGLPSSASGEAGAADTACRAAGLTEQGYPDLRGIAGALPVTNTGGLFPSSKEDSTTAVTYLYFPPWMGLQQQSDLAERFAHEYVNRPGDSLVGATGAVPARLAQSYTILKRLPWIEVATVLLIGLIVGVTFRSVGAPLATLFSAGIAYLVAVRVVSWVGERMNVSVPSDLEPVIVVLLLGVVTDYSIFFLSGMRLRLIEGDRPIRAAERTTAEFLPIIFTAGMIVTAGTAALLVARLGFLRAFGPGMALTVLVSLIVAVTLMPALIGIFGRALYWPRRIVAAPPAARAGRPRARERLARFATARPVALVVAAVSLAALVIAGLWIGQTRLGFSLVRALPGDAEANRAEDAASAGFAPGILSPTVLLVQRAGIVSQQAGLIRLERELKAQPGVAGVIGPAEQPSSSGAPDLAGAVLAGNGAAARYVVIFDTDPLGATAIDHLRAVEDRMPALLRSAGLSGVRAAFAGDTALAEETISLTLDDLGRIALATLAVDLILLMIFLRAVVAPLYLLLASVLALAAALGVTAYVFQVLLGHGDITYYVPFAAAVLLVSLGSDYNVFVVGRIWDEARRRPLRDAVAIAAPRAARAITVAGLALAGSFAVLAIVPLVQFREFAFAMVAGVLIDAFLVRSLLVPALISLFGTSSGWPGTRVAGARGLSRQ